MRELIRPLLLLCCILLIPILPVFFIGEERIASFAEDLTGDSGSVGWTALVIFGLLATDIFLPVPSSVVNTLAGGTLGVWLGTLVCWMGMNVGAIIGFWLSRRWGSSIARWFSKEGALDRMDRIVERFGPVGLMMVRGVPVLAEASVILSGVHQLSWSRFLWPVVVSNFVLALLYSAFGELAKDSEFLSIAVGIAVALPLLLMVIIGGYLKNGKEPKTDSTPRE